MYNRYAVIVDVLESMFTNDNTEGVKNALNFLEKGHEAKNNKKSKSLSSLAKTRKEKLDSAWKDRKIVTAVSELNNEYTQLNTIQKSFSKGLSAMASYQNSGSLESVGDEKLFASVDGTKTFSKSYINNKQLSKILN